MPRPTPPLPLAFALVLALAGLTLAGCDGHGHHHDDPPGGWTITVANETGITLDVYVDGEFLGRLSHATRLDGRGFSTGRHTLEALDRDGGLRARREVFLDSDFVWLLE